MALKPLWIIVHFFILGCVPVEVGIFLERLDENLVITLANPQTLNSTSYLFKDVAAYSFNIQRILRLFMLRRENVMEAAKRLCGMKPPMFLRNFSCEKVKTDFQLNEREYKNLLRFIDKITTTLNEFYEACKTNPNFTSTLLPKPEFSLEKLSSNIETMFKSPNSSVAKYKLIKTVEEYYYNLGKFTKKFMLGRKAVMERAKELFESGGPQFLKYYNYFNLQKAYSLTVSEAASLDSLIRRMQKRYEQFTHACFKNPNFEAKVDLSSIKIVRTCEQKLKEILSNPSAMLSEQLFKHLRHFYHVLGFLRRRIIPHRTELLHALFETFGRNYPTIISSFDLEKIKSAFNLEDSRATQLEEYVGHLRRRFDQVREQYLELNITDTSTK